MNCFASGFLFVCLSFVGFCCCCCCFWGEGRRGKGIVMYFLTVVCECVYSASHYGIVINIALITVFVITVITIICSSSNVVSLPLNTSHFNMIDMFLSP